MITGEVASVIIATLGTICIAIIKLAPQKKGDGNGNGYTRNDVCRERHHAIDNTLIRLEKKIDRLLDK